MEVCLDGLAGLRVTKDGEAIELSAAQIMMALKELRQGSPEAWNSHGPGR
jgi:hypothetical protein